MFELGIHGRRALVNGGAHGLGLACARALAIEGARVALFDTDTKSMHRAADEIGALALPGDSVSREHIESAVDATERDFGGIDILINAAPIEPIPSPLHEVEDAEWERVAHDQLLAYMRFMRAVTPGMRNRGHGRVVNLTGVAGRNPDPHRLPASTAAIAVLNLTKATADEFAPYGVTINAVSPGFFEKTARQLENNTVNQDPDKDLTETESVDKVPAGRTGTPQELADLVLFLVSDRASYISGASVTIDGGFTRGI